MIPTRAEAEKLLEEAEECNPGPWGNHSRTAARCAEKIAAACEGMDPEKAYILGLLHDIGRKFGVKHLGHVSDGYSYMMSLGYDEAARICLTHSFNNMTTDEYIGKTDTTDAEQELIRSELRKVVPDDYDRLIQLCDALAGSGAVIDMERRMNDVKRRYGFYPQAKWDSNLKLKAYFEAKAHRDIYELVGKDRFRLPDRPSGGQRPVRELTGREVYRLEECLMALAEHHNAVSVNFRGHFPKKPFRETLATFEKDVSSGRSRIAVIENEAGIRGFCKADIRGAEGAIDYLIVLREARGKGYGEALLDWGLDILRKSGVRRIEVRVVDGNDAVRFYEKHGFRVISHVLRLKQAEN